MEVEQIKIAKSQSRRDYTEEIIHTVKAAQGGPVSVPYFHFAIGATCDMQARRAQENTLRRSGA